MATAWKPADTALRERLEPLLDMYPVAIRELERLGDPGVQELRDELSELRGYVNAVVTQLDVSLPFFAQGARGWSFAAANDGYTRAAMAQAAPSR